MTKRSKYCAALTVVWSVYCLVTLALLHLGPFWAIAFGMGSFLIALTCAFGRRLILPCLLAGALTAAPMANAWVVQPPGQAKKVPAKPDVTVAECAMAVVIIIVGTVVLYKIWRFCDKHFPPATKSAGQPPATNNVPVSFPTNVVAALSFGTNDIGWHSFDISMYPDCSPYTVLTYTSLRTATNWAGWAESCTITQWWSVSNCVTAVYTNGTLYSSAACSSNPGTNIVTAPALGKSPMRLFKCQ